LLIDLLRKDDKKLQNATVPYGFTRLSWLSEWSRGPHRPHGSGVYFSLAEGQQGKPGTGRMNMGRTITAP